MALVQNWYLPIVGGALNVPVEKLFPLHGEERKSFLKPSRSSCEVFPPVPSLVFFLFCFVFCLLFFCSGARDQNLTWVTRNKTVIAGYKGSDQEQWSLIYLPHLIFVLHRKTKITGPQNTTARITKLRSYKGSGRQEVEVGGEMAHPGLPVHHKLPEFTQTHVHRVGDAIQPSHPLLSPSPSAPNPSHMADHAMIT